MPAQWLFYSYLMAVVAALLLLVIFRARSWYWHFFSVLLGLTAGLASPPSGRGGDLFYLIAGTACVFFCLWGIGGPFFRRHAR
jgi:hypothetical protein